MTFKEEAYIEVFPRQIAKPTIKHESMIEETEETKENGVENENEELKETEQNEAPNESMLNNDNEVGEQNNDI